MRQRLGRDGASVREHGPALGQGAGLVEDHGVDLRQALERGRRLQQHAAAHEAAAGDHLHRRHGEAERTGAGDDEHRHGMQERHLPGGAAGKGPAEEGRQRQAVHGGRIEPGHAVGEGDVAAAALLGQLHQPHDLGQSRALADGQSLERTRVPRG